MTTPQPFMSRGGDPYLPYAQLPDNAYEAARASIQARGFVREAILSNYRFISTERDHATINAYAFAHPVHRIQSEYGAITVYNVADGRRDEAIVDVLARSHALFHLIHRDGTFNFWASSYANGEVRPIRIQSNIAYHELEHTLHRFEADLKPEHLVDVKQGRSHFKHQIFRTIEPLQLSWFILEVTQRILTKYFSSAVAVLREPTGSDHYRSPGEEAITDLAVQLLGATILTDTGALGDRARLTDLSLDDLITVAAAKFGRYFKVELFEKHAEAARHAYEVMRRVSYAGFVPEMLSDLYVAAYGSEERKASGRFDTPLYLTRRIWDTLPIEFLPPDQRVVADMTCGWGSFLIAGHDRLAHLADMRDDSLGESGLQSYVHGNDRNYFTARLAGLGLLVSTSRDSWHIDDRPAHEWEWLQRRQPNIIVGNPPFGGDRKEGTASRARLVPREGRRHQEADKFLSLAIDRLAPNGYLAMLMPQSFVTAQASPGLRRQLLETCDVIELWDLPLTIFKDARVSPMVIFAKKRAGQLKRSHAPVRVRTLQSNSLEAFKTSGPGGLFTASSLVADQSVWSDEPAQRQRRASTAHSIDYHLTLPEATWQSIRSRCVNLEELAYIFQGAIPGKYQDPIAVPERVPWLMGARNALPRNFGIRYEQDSTILYPNELHRPRIRNRKLLAGPKVILTSNQNPSWGNRARVAIERKGYYISDHFWGIVPRTTPATAHINHEVIAAILSWLVSNAWIVDQLKHPKILRRTLERLPFPRDMDKRACSRLTSAARRLEEAAGAGEPEPQDALDAIDEVLTSAYQLDAEILEHLRLISTWSDASPETLDEQRDVSADTLVSGIVDDIDAHHSRITLWLQDIDGLVTVPITAGMPGWMLRREAAFQVYLRRDMLSTHRLSPDKVLWGTFQPQPNAYLDAEDLLEALNGLLDEGEATRRKTVT